MAHEWDRGVLATSSWHGLEEIGVMADAAAMVARGEDSGAWPTALRTAPLTTPCGLKASVDALVGSYASHADRILGVNGGRYRATACAEWRDLCHAAVAAGAQPTGAFSLRSGSRVLATFEVGTSNGMRTQLLLADAFDGSMRLTAGFTTIRVVCANTFAAAMGQDGSGMAQIRHTASLESRVRVLEESIGTAVKSGDRVRSTFAAASDRVLRGEDARKAFDLLFPPAAEGTSLNAATRAENARTDARLAAAKAINRAGNTSGNLGTLWNAATYLVDRTVKGTLRGEADDDGAAIDSLLFGRRGERLAEIQTVIETIMADGSIRSVNAGDAVAMSIDPTTVGRAVLADMLG